MFNNNVKEYKGPTYVFDIKKFIKRVELVREHLSHKVGLVYSIKANPFLTGYIPKVLDYLEVCSPGELTICEKTGVDMSKIIFSGVNKTDEDIQRALKDKVGIFTGESLKHVERIDFFAREMGLKVPIILRLSCGNQFGMDEKDLCNIIKERETYKGLEIIGLHMYTGTQKKKASIIKEELDVLETFILKLESDYDFEVKHVEYGPGIMVDYFGKDAQASEEKLLMEVSAMINEFAEKYSITIEMGRFLAADCGTYYTKIADTKVTKDVNYCICDGGVHQVKYYGQTMAMQVPPITVYEPVDDKEQDWSVCGSLCTVADVLVRKATLKGAGVGSILAFGKVGAYSACEGIALFLSRELPAIMIHDEEGNYIQARSVMNIDYLNTVN